MTRSERDHREPIDTDARLSDLATVRVRTRSGDPRIAMALWAVAALVGVAILKPWGGSSPEPTFRPVAVAPSILPVTPVPTEDRTSEGLASEFCLGAGTWQVASLETWREQDVRVWRAIEPARGASGPLDPFIPAAPIVAFALAALGWCAPAFGAERPAGPATITAWYVRGTTATALELHQVRPVDGETELGALYVPLTTCPDQTICAPLLRDPVPGPWVTGRVVFRYLDEGADSAVWLAADVEILSPASGTPAPSPT
ncbi:MAG: hypothetical protein ABIZ52_05215 [Candidatus Limnocylindrales bacterium]